jgi:aryl-alcohol dehydrogenase-like predicted oxidoreductase
MNDLIRQGKILYWGTSEWEAAQVTQAIGVARQLNLIGPPWSSRSTTCSTAAGSSWNWLPLTREFGLGLTTFSPLYYGILSGKYNDGIPEGSRASCPIWAGSATGSPPSGSITRQLTRLASSWA